MQDIAEALRGGTTDTSYTTAEGETWRSIRFPGFRRSLCAKAWWFVSDWGRLLTADGSRVLAAKPGKGYCQTTLAVQKGEESYGGQVGTYLHRVVAYTFLGDPPSSSFTVDHLNRVREDNRACNLRWVCPEEQLGNREGARYLVAVKGTGVVYDSINGLARATGLCAAQLSSELRQREAGEVVEVGATVLQVEAVSRKRLRTPASVGSGYGGGRKKAAGSSRKEAAFRAFVDGQSVAGICEEMGLARSTVLGYIGHGARGSPKAVLGELAERMGLGEQAERERLGEALGRIDPAGLAREAYEVAYEGVGLLMKKNAASGKAYTPPLPRIGPQYQVTSLPLSHFMPGMGGEVALDDVAAQSGWSQEDEQAFEAAFQTHPYDWARIADEMPMTEEGATVLRMRTTDEIINHYCHRFMLSKAYAAWREQQKQQEPPPPPSSASAAAAASSSASAAAAASSSASAAAASEADRAWETDESISFLLSPAYRKQLEQQHCRLLPPTYHDENVCYVRGCKDAMGGSMVVCCDTCPNASHLRSECSGVVEETKHWLCEECEAKYIKKPQNEVDAAVAMVKQAVKNIDRLRDGVLDMMVARACAAEFSRLQMEKRGRE